MALDRSRPGRLMPLLAPAAGWPSEDRGDAPASHRSEDSARVGFSAPPRPGRAGGAARIARPPRPFVFLDKDGTLVEDVPYNVDPARIRLAAGAVDALRALRSAGFGLAIVSNQSGIARGYFDVDDLERYRDALLATLATAGVGIDAFLYCPHHPDAAGPYGRGCECRKPAPGMLLRAAGELGADLDASWMVGDILDDVEAGHRAGCRAILVDRGHETEWRSGAARTPDVIVRDLREAAAAIVESVTSPAVAASVEVAP